MAKLVIEGGHQLSGTIRVGGAKNSVLKLMAATILGHGSFHLTDVPAINDVFTMIGVLRAIGVKVEFSQNELTLHLNGLDGTPPEDLVTAMRASVQVMGPLLARIGWAEIAHPGGCAIGKRPLDIHLDSLSKLGANVEIRDNKIVASAKQLKGADLTFRYPSVGATENVMMAATLAEGTTIIRNAAREPEIVDIQNFLNRMGAQVQGAGSPVITIEGVSELGCADYKVIPDRIEAGTYLMGALLTGGEIKLTNVVPEHLAFTLATLKNMGARFALGESSITVISNTPLLATDVQTAPYPGFPTDLQPQLAVLSTAASGKSRITESIYDNRFGYIYELAKLGATVSLHHSFIEITGGAPLRGTTLHAGDLRGGAALVIAALAAGGESVVTGVDHIDRGYESIECRLSDLGARIKRL